MTEYLFDKKWFKKHQNWLVAFANSFVGRKLFKIPLPINEKIHELGTNYYIHNVRIVKKNNEFVLEKTAEFYSAPCFQNVLLRPYERLIKFIPFVAATHFTRSAIAVPFLLSFATSTDFTSNANDGSERNNGLTWSTVRTAGTAASTSFGAGSGLVGDQLFNGDNNYYIDRGFYPIDTSALTSGATISSASFATTWSLGGNHIGSTFHYVKGTWATDVPANTDYSSFVNTSRGSASNTTNGRKTITLSDDGSGWSYISKTGITKAMCISADDLNNTAPSISANYSGSQCDMSEFATPSDRPILTVVYTSSTTTTLNLSETPSITERFSRAWTAPRSVNESVGLSDALTRAWSLTRGLAERITIIDSTSAARLITAVLSELVSITDSISRSVSWNRSAVESLGITESFSRVYSAIRGFSETVGITDTITRAITYGRILIDQINITEILRTPLNWLKRTKPTTTWTARTTPSPISSWTKRTPPATTYTTRSKP